MNMNMISGWLHRLTHKNRGLSPIICVLRQDVEGL